MAQDRTAADTQAAESKLRLKHIMGFEDVSKNANGELSLQGGYLRFQKNKGSSAQVSVSSIQGVTTGQEDRQVGGMPMTLAKAATPYEGGRVVSLFSHKKYDTVTLEYVDANGALHGAIFQLRKGEGQIVENELKAAGTQIAHFENQTFKTSTRENGNEPR